MSEGDIDCETGSGVRLKLHVLYSCKYMQIALQKDRIRKWTPAEHCWCLGQTRLINPPQRGASPNLLDFFGFPFLFVLFYVLVYTRFVLG